MNNLVIRRATNSDFPQLLEVHQSSIRGVASKDHTPDQVSSWGDYLSVEGYLKAKEQGEDYFVALENNIMLGFTEIEEISHTFRAGATVRAFQMEKHLRR